MVHAGKVPIVALVISNIPPKPVDKMQEVKIATSRRISIPMTCASPETAIVVTRKTKARLAGKNYYKIIDYARAKSPGVIN
jgi:hypothetical protein